MGTHPDGPCRLKRSQMKLSQHIADYEASGHRRFSVEKHLPFIMKLMSIQHNLSIQTHPTKVPYNNASFKEWTKFYSDLLSWWCLGVWQNRREGYKLLCDFKDDSKTWNSRPPLILGIFVGAGSTVKWSRPRTLSGPESQTRTCVCDYSIRTAVWISTSRWNMRKFWRHAIMNVQRLHSI